MPTSPEKTEFSRSRPKLSVFVDVDTQQAALLIVEEWNRMGIRGTLFVLPEVILENPRFWRNACANGHELGNPGLHKYSHNGELTWSREAVKEDLQEANDLLKETGHGPITLLSLDSNLTAADGEYESVLKEIFQFIVTAQEGPNSRDSVDPQALRQASLETIDPSNAQLWWIVPFFPYQSAILENLISRFDIAPIGEVAASIQAVKR